MGPKGSGKKSSNAKCVSKVRAKSKTELKQEKEMSKRNGNAYIGELWTFLKKDFLSASPYTTEELAKIEKEEELIQKQKEDKKLKSLSIKEEKLAEKCRRPIEVRVGTTSSFTSSLQSSDSKDKKIKMVECTNSKGAGCVHGFCFKCCYKHSKDSNTYCPAHFQLSKKRDIEERYIEEGLNAKKKYKTKFYHYEEKFTNFQQTVTLWCSKDFYNNPAYSGDIFEQVNRQVRSRAMAKRRSMGTVKGNNSSSSSKDKDDKSEDSSLNSAWSTYVNLSLEQQRNRFADVSKNFLRKAKNGSSNPALIKLIQDRG